MLTKLIYVLLASWFALTAVACATPPEITKTAVPPTTTPLPATATTAPTPEPTAKPTLTADQLRDGRATAVLTTLPGYDPARHDALLPLARALWGDEYQVVPADVALVVGETAVQVTSDAAYPAGTLFVWNADSQPQPLILTGQENSTINRGEVAFGAATLNTWVRYDLDDNVLEFVDPAGNWISPLDIQTDGRFSFFTQERILADGSRENTNTVWWANGGQPTEIPNGPDGKSMADFLGDDSEHQLTETIIDGQPAVAIAGPDGSILYTYSADARQWDMSGVYRAADLVFEKMAVGVVAEAGFLKDVNSEIGVQFNHSTNIDWDVMPGYVSISNGDNRLLMQEAEFRQLMQSRWDALSNQEVIDRYAVTSETRIVNIEGINMPITFANNLSEYTIIYDDLYYQDTAHRWLYASYLRYQIGYPDTSFDDYKELVRQGKGQYVAPVLASADSSAYEFIFVDPSMGMTFVLADTTV